MEIEIFDVEHGACTLVTADTGRRVLIDCGHNGSTGWRPSAALPARGIRQVDALVVSNYDEDHVSDFPNVMQCILVPTLFRNPSVTPEILRNLKAENGMGAGIGSLARMAGRHYTAPVTASVDLGDLEMLHFWNRYPWFQDENNLSLVTILRCPGLGVIFPGDLETDGWKSLLTRPDFRAALSDVNVFIASHHGRETGYCREVFDYCRPEVVIVSDKAIVHETQRSASLYRPHASGIQFFDGVRRYVLTTRSNGYIRISRNGPGQAFVWISSR